VAVLRLLRGAPQEGTVRDVVSARWKCGALLQWLHQEAVGARSSVMIETRVRVAVAARSIWRYLARETEEVAA